MTVLALKLLLAPGFVVAASLAGRRYGMRVGGLVGGLPVVAGPLLLVYALVHGRPFAAHAAAATLLGMVSLSAYVVAYGRVSGLAGWRLCVTAGIASFAGCTLILSSLPQVAAVPALALALGAIVGGLALLPRPQAPPSSAGTLPGWDLPLRAGCALALVLSLTGVSGWLGPHVSGLLTPFPIITTVLAAFTHSQRGREEALRLLRAMLTGFGAYALFCMTLAVSVVPLRTPVAFALASVVALVVQTAFLLSDRRVDMQRIDSADPRPTGWAGSDPARTKESR